MGYPKWAAGERITAGKLNALVTAVVKSATEAVTNSATMQNDDELFAPVVANATYRVQLMLLYDAPTAGDIQIGWTGPTGATLTWTPGGAATSEGTSFALTSMNYQTRLITEIAAIGGSTSTGVMADVTGTLIVGSTAGTLQFRWAQNTANATATNVRANSHLILTRIG